MDWNNGGLVVLLMQSISLFLIEESGLKLKQNDMLAYLVMNFSLLNWREWIETCQRRNLAINSARISLFLIEESGLKPWEGFLCNIINRDFSLLNWREWIETMNKKIDKNIKAHFSLLNWREWIETIFTKIQNFF